MNCKQKSHNWTLSRGSPLLLFVFRENAGLIKARMKTILIPTSCRGISQQPFHLGGNLWVRQVHTRLLHVLLLQGTAMTGHMPTKTRMKLVEKMIQKCCCCSTILAMTIPGPIQGRIGHHRPANKNSAVESAIKQQ